MFLVGIIALGIVILILAAILLGRRDRSKTPKFRSRCVYSNEILKRKQQKSHFNKYEVNYCSP